MHEPVRHIVVDANIIAAHLHAKSTHSEQMQSRSDALIRTAIDARWHGIKLYSPSICIAESLAVLDKYRYCDWIGPAKADPTKRIPGRTHERQRSRLMDAIKEQRIAQVELPANYALLTGLVSPINQRYQYRRKPASVSRKPRAQVKPPMSATDCLVVGLAIYLKIQVGSDSVCLVTNDQRMVDVVHKAKKLQVKQAIEMGLPSVAERIGVHWSTDLYPNAVNIQRATTREICSELGGWPLPTSRVKDKTLDLLDDDEKSCLVECWNEASEYHGLTNPDRLPYSRALQEIRTAMAERKGTSVSSRDTCHFLIGLRKQGKLTRS